MTNAMKMTTARGKQMVVGVVLGFWVRKRKIINKWRMIDDENSKGLDCSLP
ncbi:hypothetical protein [Anoxybacillus flavithermus]|uniref:hypothetical protein n=1 Tax=Anoxybacillus flavithermus TaxID=33934 RepID=UPI0018681718|nr:hypothetical protein [Anoxybacillus flavithermus]MBE2926581.1 hypothetical protein [Anoxybacillus flavithermus]MBE2937452.1 hypothetical protein [Anoxybacillus flavithermus]MBE2945126.1 hypothetical protein [Anoxybacillus flavithermus]MBE2948118.1 hypothetical protein [Anoxybacillus flavithermus]